MSDGYGETHYRMVADVYLEAIEADTADDRRRQPTQAVAQTWNIPHTTAAAWVKRARNLGLLADTVKGRPGDPVCRHRCPVCCPPL